VAVDRCLRIDLVGATSSGKSTLANALVGRWLLPAGVQEVTRSPIQVRHTDDDTVRRLRFRGVTRTLDSDALVRAALTEEMRLSVGPIVLTTQTEIGRTLQATAGPRGAPRVAFMIVDHPGMRDPTDEERLRLIRRACRDGGLLIVVLDAEETDPTRELPILEAAIGAIVDGPPSRRRRAVFVLSRCDVLLRDEDPQETERVVVERLLGVMREVARRQRPRARVPAFDLLPVAPRAALVAAALGTAAAWLDERDRTRLQHDLEQVAPVLLPWTLRLPRSSARWSLSDREEVLRDLRVASGLPDVVAALRAGAQCHRPRFAAPAR
jgi:hypothetical protein